MGKDALDIAACCRLLYTLIVPSVYASPRLCNLCHSIERGLSRLAHISIDRFDLTRRFLFLSIPKSIDDGPANVHYGSDTMPRILQGNILLTMIINYRWKNYLYYWRTDDSYCRVDW